MCCVVYRLKIEWDCDVCVCALLRCVHYKITQRCN